MKKNKSLKEIWNQVPADYYETGVKNNVFQWFWHTWKWRTLKKILKNSSLAPNAVLDVGCSSGHITSKIADFFPKARVEGIDVYDKSIKLGRKLHTNVKFKLGDAHNLPYGSSNFDLVTCIETLEHLENPAKVIEEIRRVSKSHGRVLIGQDTDSLIFRMIWFLWTKTRGRVWENSHIHPLTPQKLQSLLEKNGFKLLNKRFSALGLEVFFLAEKAS